MLLKKLLALALLLCLCVLGVDLWKRGWPFAIIPLDLVAGMMAMLLYEGRNFFKGPWDSVKIPIVAFGLVLGYLSLAVFIIIAQEKEVPNRS
ncbi:hypothetical protein EPO17_03385 [Patescibacteria group bacterium]|nr:MAG: hypothetical protein EPO17_03385 [Patescibacteria group bacterium]